MAKGTTVYKDFMSLGQVETLKNNSTKVRWQESGGDFSDGIRVGIPAKVKNGSIKPLSEKELKLEVQRVRNKKFNTTHIELKAYPRTFQTSIGEYLITDATKVINNFLYPNEIQRHGEVKAFYYSKNEEECSKVFRATTEMEWVIEHNG